MYSWDIPQKGYSCYFPYTYQYCLLADVLSYEESAFFLSVAEPSPMSQVFNSSVHLTSYIWCISSWSVCNFHWNSHWFTSYTTAYNYPSSDLLVTITSCYLGGNHCAHNTQSIYNFLIYHHLFSSNYVFVSSLSSITFRESSFAF